MDQEQRMTDQQLFARWAGDDLPSWERAIGMTMTHLSRGDGLVRRVTREAGQVAVEVEYGRSNRTHAPWELRTEFTRMTLPEGLVRADLIPGARARRLLREQDRRTNHAVLPSRRRGLGAATSGE